MPGKRKTLAEAGEYEFIRHIRGMMPRDGGTIVRSVGDDCLVVKSPPRKNILLTTDTFVEHVHFSRDYADYRQIGSRCMTAAVSDIAAMAGFPVYSLVSLSLPRTLVFNDAVALFSGLQKTAEFYDCPVAGGETTSSPGPSTITITVIGICSPSKAILRSGAKPGDSIYVTGTVGDAMGGLLAFQRGEEGYAFLKEKFLAPTAQVTLARSLAEIYRLTALIDLSDGIATDLTHICEESRCGAEIFKEALPISPELRDICNKQELSTVEFALCAGEDFGLLFTANDKSLGSSFRFMNQPVTRIGQIHDKASGIMLQSPDGTSHPLTTKGYEHFRT